MNANAMMSCDVRMNVQTHIRSHTCSHFSLETITHQLCIPLGMTLELLRLLLSAESALTFRCKLCIPLGTTLELLRLLLFGTRWCVLSFYIYIFGGFRSYRAKNKKLHVMAPLKTFLPLQKGKGCHEKRKNIKNYIKLHIISPKLIRIPRSRNVVAVHILQSV
jgi:hypothetical protein